MDYYSSIQEIHFLSIHFRTRDSTMKFAIRIFALSVVVAGATAATLSSASTHAVASHLSATASLPVPGCGPHVPTCPPNPNPTK